jgi:hypothetical protein
MKCPRLQSREEAWREIEAQRLRRVENAFVGSTHVPVTALDS